MKKSALAIPFLLLFASLCASAAANPAADEFRFRVLYDDRPIGTHAFTVTSEDEETRVTSEARFKVKILFVPVYRYAHNAEEVWTGDCLAELESTTNDNGTRYAVQLGPEDLTANFDAECPGSFAYWDASKLAKSQLINSQTGTVSDLELTYVGTETVSGMTSDRYLLTGAGIDPISVWYRSADKRWVALETELDGGLLRYEPLDA